MKNFESDMAFLQATSEFQAMAKHQRNNQTLWPLVRDLEEVWWNIYDKNGYEYEERATVPDLPEWISGQLVVPVPEGYEVVPNRHEITGEFNTHALNYTLKVAKGGLYIASATRRHPLPTNVSILQ